MTIAAAHVSEQGGGGGRNRLCISLIAVILLCLVGFVISIDSAEVYLKIRIDPDFKSSCAISETVNCEKVEQSEYAALFGVPTALWAATGYALMAGFALAGLFIRRQRRERGILLVFTTMTMGFSLVLIYLMKFVIGSWCTLCLASDAVNLGLFVMTILAIKADHSSLIGTVISDLKWVFGKPLVLAAHVLWGLALVGLTLLASAQFIDKPLAEVAREEAELSQVMSQQGKLASNQDWAHEAVPSEECGPDCTCDSHTQAQAGSTEKQQTIQMGVDKDGHSWIGSINPQLTIDEYTDYECPHCRKGHMRLRRLLSKYPDKIRIVHRHFPLDNACNRAVPGRFHLRACELSKIALCAEEQGRFWEMNDLLFQSAKEIKSSDLTAEDLARRLELDVDKFQCCLSSDETLKHIKQDIESGISLGIGGTPSFVIDGKLYEGGIPPDVLGDLN